jgi:hypothetical protein
MNLGSAAGAGIADHLHQHLVPRWVGDANFMPIVGGTKVLPELIPASYAKIRAEVARQRSGATAVTAILLTGDRSTLLLDGERLPAVSIAPDGTPWDSLREALVPFVDTCELLAWGGAASTIDDATDPPAVVVSITLRGGADFPWRTVATDAATSILPPQSTLMVSNALARLT